MPCVVLCLFLILPWVGLCSVSLSHCAVGWFVSLSFSHYAAVGLCLFLLCCRLVCLYLTVSWVGLCSVSLSRCAMGRSVFCLFLIVTLVGVCSVSLSYCAVGLSVFCVSFSLYSRLVCVL